MTSIQDLSAGIGNTPMAEIKLRYRDQIRRVFAKLEYYNLTGSVKDRMALYILKKAIETGQLKDGDIIVEATSGNTGISFSCLGTALGHKVIIYMPDWMSQERQNILQAYGAQLELVSKDDGGFIGSVEQANRMAERSDTVFLPRQFENPDNIEGQFQSLGREIVEFAQSLGTPIDKFVAGVGTGGVVSGAGRAIREVYPDATVHPLEPTESPTLSTGHKVGHHRIAGISDEFIPDNCNLAELDSVVTVSDGDSIIMAQMLAHAGLGVGISSGANLLGALSLFETGDETIVTVFSDDNKKYLSTDLMQEIPVEDHYMTSDIEILGVTIHR